MLFRQASRRSTLSAKTLGRTLAAADLGLHVNVSVRPAPTLTYGLIRSHSYTKAGKTITWRDIETAPGVYDWAAADEWVNAHSGDGRYLIAEVSVCPDWAVSAAVVPGAAWGGKSNQVPTNLANLQAFAQLFAARYAGKVQAIGGWNEPNLNPKYWVGTAAQLAAAQRALYLGAKAGNPAVLVLSPEFTSVFSGVDGAPAGQVGLRQYLAASDGAGGTGALWFDVCGYHFYSNDSALRPTGLERMYRGVVTELATAGRADVQIWATETGVIVPEYLTLTVSKRKELMRAFVLTLFGLGCQKVLWFSVDESTIGFGSGAERDEIAAAWNALAASLIGRVLVAGAVYTTDQSTMTVQIETDAGRLTADVADMPK